MTDLSSPKGSYDPLRISPDQHGRLHFTTNSQAAKFWFAFGFNIVPLCAGSEQRAVPTDRWPAQPTDDDIERHWAEHPDDDIGCVLADDCVALHTTSEAAEHALWNLVREHGSPPALLASGRSRLYFRTCDEAPVPREASQECIGVRGPGQVTQLPGSTDTTMRCFAPDLTTLRQADPDFLEAVAQYNEQAAGPVTPVESTQAVSDEPLVPTASEKLAPARGAEQRIAPFLDRFSLRGCAEDVAKQVAGQVFVLGEVALQGQATVLYAAPNTGKTLLTLSLLMAAITAGRIAPEKVYYVNVDDTSTGLLEKVRIAEEYGFHMVAEGYRDFVAKDLVGIMDAAEEVHGLVVVLDTLKKFTNLMDKTVSSRFTAVMRRFVMKGGTVIALAHTNKNPGRDGKRVYAGTSDIVDDFDCAYVLDGVSADVDSNQKVVEFTNIKRRGSVALSAAYAYALEREISYTELLASVKEVQADSLLPIKHAAEVRSDAPVIAAIEACIAEGVNTKMKLAETASKRACVSQRDILKALDRYCGNVAGTHRWSFAVRERGAMVYELLAGPPTATS